MAGIRAEFLAEELQIGKRDCGHRSFWRGLSGGVEGGDGAGLDGDSLVLGGDGGVGGFELGFAFGQFGAELGERIYGDIGRFFGVVLSEKHFGEVEDLVG